MAVEALPPALQNRREIPVLAQRLAKTATQTIVTVSVERNPTDAFAGNVGGTFRFAVWARSF